MSFKEVFLIFIHSTVRYVTVTYPYLLVFLKTDLFLCKDKSIAKYS